ncbi:MAG: hypothetical protein WAL77_05020 [Candidatus Dormiibacterota bacterium]
MKASNSMRTTVVIGACALVAAMSACGAPATVVPTAPDPTTAVPPGSATPSGSSSACANPQVSSTISPVTQLTLTVSDLPSGGPSLEQISDGEMHGAANTDQRGFANVANTYRVEVDVVLDASTQSATADYPQFREAAKTQFASITSSASLPTLGCQADEFVGKTLEGYSQVGVAFQEGDVVAVVLVVNSAAPVEPAFAAAVAAAQDQKIVAAAA